MPLSALRRRVLLKGVYTKCKNAVLPLLAATLLKKKLDLAELHTRKLKKSEARGGIWLY